MSVKPGVKGRIEIICKYGAACNRKGCFYKHTKSLNKSPDPLDPSVEICFSYLAGTCSFGPKCFNRHPSDEECENIVSKLGSKPCKFGRNCYTEGCLYNHESACLDSNPSSVPIAKAPVAPVVMASGPIFKAESVQEIPTISNLPVIKIPACVWRTYPENIAAEAFAIENPLERFAFVNSQAKAAPSIVDNEGCFVLDLHFQSTKTVFKVLEQIFPQCIKYLSADFGTNGNNIWLITGSGNSVPRGHQVRGGVLYDTVLREVVDLATKHDGLDVSEAVAPNGVRGAIRLRQKR
jgi:hypothetical protein